MEDAHKAYKDSMLKSLQSLIGVNVRPLCKDHRPVADVINTEEAAVLPQVRCKNCGLCMTMSVEIFLEISRDNE